MKGTSLVVLVLAAFLPVPAPAQGDSDRTSQELIELRRSVQQLSLELKSAAAQWDKGLRELKALGEAVAALKEEQKELALAREADQVLPQHAVDRIVEAHRRGRRCREPAARSRPAAGRGCPRARR